MMLFDDSMYIADDWFWAQSQDWAAEIRADYAAHPEMFVDPADLVWDDFDSEEVA
jgi:hypothetical protein